MKMRVLMLTQYPFVADDERLGGIMQASFRLVRAIDALQDTRVELTVLTQSPHATSIVTRSLPGGTKVIYAPQHDTSWDKLLFGYPPVSRALSIAICDLNPDLIHGQGTAKYIYAAIHSGRPHVVTVHGIYKNEMQVVKSRLSLAGRFSRWVKIRLESHYISQIQHLIAITDEVSRYVRSAAPSVEVFPIDNTIDEDFFAIRPIDDTMRPVVLFVAAITYRKGLDFLLAAFRDILATRPDATLRVAGIWEWDPSYVDDLRQQYRDEIAKGSVSFLGGITQEQLITEMTEAAVLCLPSRAESAPMVISQAMASARPVVASRVGGIPNMISDGVDGYLWEPGDLVSLAKMVNGILNDPQTARLMGLRGRQAAIDRHSAKSVASKTLDAYLHIAANG